MDPLTIFLIFILSLLTILLTVVGIQVFFLIKEARFTLTHYNSLLKRADRIINHLEHSVDDLSDTVSGLRSGLKLVEAFTLWVQKQHGRETLPK